MISKSLISFERLNSLANKRHLQQLGQGAAPNSTPIQKDIFQALGEYGNPSENAKSHPAAIGTTEIDTLPPSSFTMTPPDSNLGTPEAKANPFETSLSSIDTAPLTPQSLRTQSPEIPTSVSSPKPPEQNETQPASKKRKRGGDKTDTTASKKPLNDDWKDIKDPDERRRTQNRIAQRTFRKKNKEAKKKELLAKEQAKKEQIESSHSRNLTNFVDSLFQANW